MKCRNCGAELGLLDRVCPHCGSVNEQSADHIKERDEVLSTSQKTEEKLKKSVSVNLPMVIGVLVMLILLVGIGVASYVAENAFLFDHNARRKDALKNSEKYTKVLEQYIEQGDYTGFYAYKELHVIPEYEPPYQDYNLLWDLVKEYNRCMNAIEEAVMYGPEARRYNMDSYVKNCQRAVSSFYREYDSLMKKADDYKYRDTMVDMRDKVGTAAKVYLGLDEKALEEYLAMSENRQLAYLEEVLIP